VRDAVDETGLATQIISALRAGRTIERLGTALFRT
jgi:hypothetical protein